MTITKRKLTTLVLSVIMILTLCIGLMPMLATTASATDATKAEDLTVTIDTGASITLTDSDSDGYYDIDDANELRAFAKAVNDGNTTINAALTQDIDMSAFTDFTIGSSNKPYAGTFDGNGNTIMLALDGAGYVALVSYANGVTIKNLALEGTLKTSLQFSGSFIGKAVDGNVTIENCITSLAMTFTRSNEDGTHGGFVGLNEANLVIKNSAFTGSFISESCYNNGGFVGWTKNSNGCTIENCYIAASFDAHTKIDGCETFSRNPGNVTVKNSYYLNSLGDATHGTKVTADKFASGEIAYRLNGENAGTENTVWKQTIDTDDYPNFTGSVVYANQCAGVIYKYSNTAVVADSHTAPADGVENCAEGYNCTVCNTVVNTHTPPATWDCTEGYECEICKAKVEAAAHKFSDGFDCTAGAYTCKVCNTEFAASEEHSLTNGLCSICDYFTPATETKGKYDVNGDGQVDADAVVYEIGNAGQLYWFAAEVNGGNTSINGVLTANIDLNPGYSFTFVKDTGLVEIKKGGTVVAYLGTGAKGDASGSNTTFDETASTAGAVYANANDATADEIDLSGIRVLTSIGYYNNSDDHVDYAGIFDGNGKTVSGLYFNNASTWYVGLFSRVGVGGIVKNMGVLDSYILGKNRIGSVAGINSGTVTNCYNTGTVIGADGSYHTGGVVGYNNHSTVTNCYNTGTVIGDDWVGGVAGTNTGTVTNCYNTGTVIGDDWVGGVVGQNWYGTAVTNCYYKTGTAGGGIGGEDIADSAEAKTAEQFASGEVAWLLNSGVTDGTQAFY